MRFVSSIAAAAVVCAAMVSAEDKKVAKPEGPWSKESNPFKLKFDFKKDDVLVFSMVEGANGMSAECKLTYDKDKVTAEIQKYTKMGDFPVTKEKGFKFSFKYELKDKKLVIKDFSAPDSEGAAQTVEGEYSVDKGD